MCETIYLSIYPSKNHCCTFTLHFRCLGAPRWSFAGALKGGTSGKLAPSAGQDYAHVDWASLLAPIGLEGRPPSLLKIDCEGCEVDVLLGQF